MATVADVVASILNFSDQEFYQLDTQTIEMRETDLLETDFFGIAINAPKQIFTGQSEQLPLLLALRCDGERDWDVPLADNCVLAGMNLTEGSVCFASALITEKELASRGGSEAPADQPKPAQEELAGEGVVISKVDVRKQLSLPWRTSTWSFAILHYDWPSNSTLVYLQDPSKKKPNVIPKPVKPLPHPKAGSYLPDYQHHPLSPPMPNTGAYFRIINHTQESTKHCSVYGAFNFKFKEAYIPEANTKHAFNNGDILTVSAVIPVTFAVLSKNCSMPLFTTWMVPVYDSMLNPGESGQGYFAIDISELTDQLEQGTFISYILLDGEIYGPETLNLSKGDVN